MKRIALLACLLMAACATTGRLPPPDAGGPPPAERCDDLGTVDSRAVCTAFAAFDVALDAVAVLRDTGVIRPGTPKAVAVADAIDATDAALADASAIQRGIRSGDLAGTLLRATAAINRLREALRR